MVTPDELKHRIRRHDDRSKSVPKVDPLLRWYNSIGGDLNIAQAVEMCAVIGGLQYHSEQCMYNQTPVSPRRL